MGIYQVTHKATWLLQEIRNIYYYETVVGEPSDAEWQDIVDEIRADYLAELDGSQTSDYEWYGIDRRRVDTAGLLTFQELPTAGPVPGQSATDSLPTQIAVLVSVKGTTTKPNRARTYLGGFTEAAVVDSQVIAAIRNSCETFVDLQSVLNAAGTNELQRVAAQWNSGHTAVIASNNIAGQASKASIVPATQRRRRLGVGI